MSGVALAAGPARAHVAAAPDDNNRYLTLSPQRDRVRLAYTILYGERPGHALRQLLDADHDGLTDSDATAHVAKLAAQVAAGLELEIDGVAQGVTWADIRIGWGTPSADAGSWSVDLIAWGCAAGSDGAHHVRLRDRVDLPQPGETELTIVPSTGITIDRARVGAADPPGHDFLFYGARTALATDGLELDYTAGPLAGPGSAGPCVATPVARGSARGFVIAAASAGAALGLGAMLWARRRTRRAASST